MHHYFSFFFFNDPATTEIYTLSLHDALPISLTHWVFCHGSGMLSWRWGLLRDRELPVTLSGYGRSEEHTSELQSQSNLVCRLLLEKKKKTIINILRAHTRS